VAGVPAQFVQVDDPPDSATLARGRWDVREQAIGRSRTCPLLARVEVL